MHKELSKNKVSAIIIDINKNFLEAGKFNLSSIKPKKKIKNEVRKNKIKFLLFSNIISLRNKIWLLNIIRGYIIRFKKIIIPPANGIGLLCNFLLPSG